MMGTFSSADSVLLLIDHQVGTMKLIKKVSAAELKGLNIEPDDFHGDWNYVIRPRPMLR